MYLFLFTSRSAFTLHTCRLGRCLTRCGWRSVPMCWRQRGGSVALWRQTPLGSEPSSSCFCSTRPPRSAFCSGFSRFDRLSLGLLELELILHRVFVSALHKAQHGPLTAAPCRQKSSDTLKFNSKEQKRLTGSDECVSGARAVSYRGLESPSL